MTEIVFPLWWFDGLQWFVAVLIFFMAWAGFRLIMKLIPGS